MKTKQFELKGYAEKPFTVFALEEEYVSPFNKFKLLNVTAGVGKYKFKDCGGKECSCPVALVKLRDGSGGLSVKIGDEPAKEIGEVIISIDCHEAVDAFIKGLKFAAGALENFYPMKKTLKE